MDGETWGFHDCVIESREKKISPHLAVTIDRFYESRQISIQTHFRFATAPRRNRLDEMALVTWPRIDGG